MDYHHLEGEEEGVEQVLVVGEEIILRPNLMVLVVLQEAVVIQLILQTEIEM